MKFPNPYEEYLVKLIRRNIELLSFSERVRMELIESVKNFGARKGPDNLVHGSYATLYDWTPKDKSVGLTHLTTTVDKKVLRSEYPKEVEKILELQWNLSFAQLFEAFESFVKDCICTYDSKRERGNYRFRDKREGQLKKDGGELYNEYSANNLALTEFKDILDFLTEARHSITHSGSKISQKIVKKNEVSEILFKRIYKLDDLGNGYYYLRLDKFKQKKALSLIINFAFQIFKIYSINGGHNWENIFHKNSE